jgi:hypothetical protein
LASGDPSDRRGHSSGQSDPSGDHHAAGGPTGEVVPAATLLGEEQWAWLGAQLSTPGYDLRAVASSLALASAYHGFEAWSLFPDDRASCA